MAEKKIILESINFYQKVISPFLGKRCRFYPSCSDYVLESFKKNNFFAAAKKSLLRILKCSPVFKGGIDNP